MDIFPKWNSFTPEAAAKMLPELLAQAEERVAEVESARPSLYEALVHKLDDATRELWRTWGMLHHMVSVMNSEAWRKVQGDFQPKVVAFSLRVGQSRAIYGAAKALLAEMPEDDASVATRRRILVKMVEGAEHSGVALEGADKERFNAIQAELAKLSMDFSNSLLDATNAFKYEKDGKTYTIDDANYPQTMKECSDREVREVLCRARAVRAKENAPRIDRMLELNLELAKLLGYANYAELSVASKSAPSVKAVYEMFAELDEATIAIAESERAELQDVKSALPEGAEIEPWDVAYLSERLREKKYAYSEEVLKRYFEFEDVLKGLFKISNFLFGIEVVELSGAERPEVWHEDVRFFQVREGGEAIAHFYVDPYVRNGLKRGGAWMNEFANRSDVNAAKPLALMVLNQTVPDADGKCFMPFREVETLFHEFGHALQCMLTRVGEEDAAGINLVEWDAVEVASQFMENWCLDPRTGIQVPEDLKKKVLAAKNFRAASLCRRQLALGKTDMDLYSATEKVDHDNVKKDVFTHFGMPLVDGDSFLCSFTHIFGGGYAAGYYGYQWSEVMSADVFGAFEEAGLENDDGLMAVGRRLRETLYALGGSKSAYEVFMDFRGRRPTTRALLRQQGLAG